MLLKTVAAAVLFIAAGGAGAQDAAVSGFSFVVTNFGAAYALNNHEEIAVSYNYKISVDPRAGVLINGRLTDLHDLLTADKTAGSYAIAINSDGNVAGYSEAWAPLPGNPKDKIIVKHAFLFREGRGLALPAEGEESSAAAINDHDQVVGSIGNDRSPEAVLWDKGKLIRLGRLPDETKSAAVAINNRGEIVGTSGHALSSVDVRGFVWENGRMADLGDLGGARVSPKSINDKGQVVGSAVNKKGELRGFLWQDGKMTELPILTENQKGEKILENSEACVAVSINNRSQIVGQCDLETDTGIQGPRAVLWQNGKIIDLNSLVRANSGWFLNWPVQINDREQVIGRGRSHGVDNSYFFLTLP